MAKKKLGSVKRFGARYGRRVKLKLAKIEAVQRGKHQCPYCHAWAVKRIASGIWNCKKCEAKFTGKSYSTKKLIVAEEEPVKKVIVKAKKKETNEEETEEEKAKTYKEERVAEPEDYKLSDESEEESAEVEKEA